MATPMNTRNILAYLLANYMILSGRVKRSCKKVHQGDAILSVYFHAPDKKLFVKCVQWFLKNKFNFISLAELQEIIQHNKPFPKSSVVFTVDDGWASNQENIVAVADKFKIPVAIFASTQPIEKDGAYWWSYIQAAQNTKATKFTVSALKKVSNEEREKEVATVKNSIILPREALTVSNLQIISRSPYITIGSHTVTHPILSTCSDAQASFEIVESQKILEKWLDYPVKTFAYPNGNYKQREKDILKAAGYAIAFTTEPNYLTAEDFKNPFELPRFDVLEDVSFSENICRMTGTWFNKKLLSKI